MRLMTEARPSTTSKDYCKRHNYTWKPLMFKSIGDHHLHDEDEMIFRPLIMLSTHQVAEDGVVLRLGSGPD